MISIEDAAENQEEINMEKRNVYFPNYLGPAILKMKRN
jgi:hypothetical protein